MSRIRFLCEFSIYTSLAFIFSYLESLIPLPLPFPGMKLGLANLVVLIVLYQKNPGYALGLSMLRNLLNAFTFGSLFSLLYSTAGSLLSLFAMALTLRFSKKRLSILSVSALGGISHNLGQLLSASFFVGIRSILWYAPALYFSGLITGILTGWLAGQVVQRIKNG